ncbi:MAG: tetratricopeptide repeat protein [Pseudomonadota bacterium]|nr:tetratricopeptide repeat protein [Pseudomonadota bacterium]
MARKPSRKKTAAKAKPELAQLKAIERLLEQEDYQAAVRRTRPLVQQFPNHGGLRRSLVEALQATEGPGAAGLAAFEWAEERRNSLPAQETLLYYAATLQLPALAGRAARRVRELGGDVPGSMPDPTDLEELSHDSLGPGSSVEDLERLEIGQLHLAGQDLHGAIRWLDGMEQTSARNNRAVALFHLQRVDEALAVFMGVWQEHPESLFALSWAIQLRLYRGDETGALGLCTPLAAGVPNRLDHALPQIQVLLLMQRNEPALEVFRKALDSGLEDAATGRAGALLLHYGACAACRLGLHDEARHLWREALDIDSGLHLAQANLSGLERAAEPPAFPQALEVQTIFPVRVVSTLRDLKEDAELDAVDASNAYIEAAYISGDEVVRAVASLPLKFRAGQGDIDAVRRLKAFARLPIGSKVERFSYLKFLREHDLMAAEEPMELWGDDGLTEVKLLSTIVDREPASSGLPMDLDALLSQSIELMQEHRINEAEPLLERLLGCAPGHPVATSNLAALREMQGRHDEVRQLLRQVAAEHPDYLFGRCNLARLLITDGEFEEARSLLHGLAERERMHVCDMFTLYGTLAMLHMAKGDDTTAQRFLASLEPLVETEDDERRFTQVRALVNRVMPKGMFGSILRRMAGLSPQPYKRRR